MKEDPVRVEMSFDRRRACSSGSHPPNNIQKLINRAHDADVVMSQTMVKLKGDLTKKDDAAARVDLDSITRIEEGAQREKAEALRDANQLEPTTSPTAGSGTVAVNPNGPFGGYDQYVATLSMDPTQVQKDKGFTLVFPNGERERQATTPAPTARARSSRATTPT